MLEIQLPAIYRTRSTSPTEQGPAGDDGSGLPEGHVLTASVRRLRPVPDTSPTVEDDLGFGGFGAGPVSLDGDEVSIDELLDGDRTEERRPVDARIARLFSLLGIAAAAVVLLVLMLAAGTDIASVFESLPGP